METLSLKMGGGVGHVTGRGHLWDLPNQAAGPTAGHPDRRSWAGRGRGTKSTGAWPLAADCDPRAGARHADHGTPRAHVTLAWWCPREMSRHVTAGQPDTCPQGQGFQDTGV